MSWNYIVITDQNKNVVFAFPETGESHSPSVTAGFVAEDWNFDTRQTATTRWMANGGSISSDQMLNPRTIHINGVIKCASASALLAWLKEMQKECNECNHQPEGFRRLYLPQFGDEYYMISGLGRFKHKYLSCLTCAEVDIDFVCADPCRRGEYKDSDQEFEVYPGFNQTFNVAVNPLCERVSPTIVLLMDPDGDEGTIDQITMISRTDKRFGGTGEGKRFVWEGQLSTSGYNRITFYTKIPSAFKDSSVGSVDPAYQEIRNVVSGEFYQLLGQTNVINIKLAVTGTPTILVTHSWFEMFL